MDDDLIQIWQKYADAFAPLIEAAVEWWENDLDEATRTLLSNPPPTDNGQGMTLDELLGDIDRLTEEPT